MLVIRDAQWEAFEGDVGLRFANLLAEEVTATWTEACAGLTPREVLQRVSAALEHAIGHGLESQPAQRRFVHLDFMSGASFDTLPWAQLILSWSAAPEVKLNALEEMAQDLSLAQE
jgi:hypothetical protein